MFDLEEGDKKVTQYLIPANVTTRFELIDGIGLKETKYIVLALAIGISLYFLLGIFTKTENVKISELPFVETIGLEEDPDSIIEGDILIKKSNAIPAPIRLFFMIIPAAGTYFVVRRDKSTGLSLAKSIQDRNLFIKKQRRYLYKYDSGAEV